MNKNILFLSLALICMAATPTPKLKIWLCGDSTMAIKQTKAYPETGWGMPFVYFWDSTVEVKNLAKNGRSTRTFISEGLWQQAMDGMQEGDFVILQFGHNDEVKEKVGSYTAPDQYKANLSRFINETRSKKAIPILLTPVSRRKFDSAGKQVQTHEYYSELVREVASQEKVLFIDIDTQSQALYQQLGKDVSAHMFLQLQAGEHPNYPDGKIDNTHFNELGARWIAQMVLKNIKALNTPLNQHIIVPTVK
jgi:lysophospholipase L1-like esterase